MSLVHIHLIPLIKRTVTLATASGWSCLFKTGKSTASFLWKLQDNKEEVDVYHASGKNEYLVLCESDCVAFGGGYLSALRVYKILTKQTRSLWSLDGRRTLKWPFWSLSDV